MNLAEFVLAVKIPGEWIDRPTEGPNAKTLAGRAFNPSRFRRAVGLQSEAK
jgi:hypothetical protein